MPAPSVNGPLTVNCTLAVGMPACVHGYAQSEAALSTISAQIFLNHPFSRQQVSTNVVILSKGGSGAWWGMENAVSWSSPHTHIRTSSRGAWVFDFTQVPKQLLQHTEVRG